MKVLALVSFALLFSFRSVYAISISDILFQDTEEVCYSQNYSESDLSNNPNQSIKSLKVSLTQEEDALYLDLEAYVTKILVETYDVENEKEDGSFSSTVVKKSFESFERYTAGMFCNQDKNDNSQLFCQIDCDGGNALITLGLDQNSESIKFTNYNLSVKGGCGDDDIENVVQWLRPSIEDSQKFTEGDGILSLSKMPEQECSSFNKSLFSEDDSRS